MKDMLSMIYNELINQPVIATECEDRIKFYLYPETGNMDKPFITIRPLQPPKDVNYGSDESLGKQFFYQVDVQSRTRVKCKEIQQAVNFVMRGLGYTQRSGGLDEYFEETGRFVDARRYYLQTKLYDIDY